MFFQIFTGYRQHAAGARCWVINGAHHAGFGQHVVVFDEQQIDHQADDFARGEMFTGSLIGDFGELADQLLEHQPHLPVADYSRVQVDIGKFLRHLVEQPGFGKAIDLGVEIEALENIAHRWRKFLNIFVEIFLDVVLIAHQFFYVHRRGVVETLPGLAQHIDIRVHTLFHLRGIFGKHGGLGCFQNAVEAAQHGERQNHLAIFRLLVVTTQKVGNRPDEGRKCLLVHVQWPKSGLAHCAGYAAAAQYADIQMTSNY